MLDYYCLVISDDAFHNCTKSHSRISWDDFYFSSIKLIGLKYLISFSISLWIRTTKVVFILQLTKQLSWSSLTMFIMLGFIKPQHCLYVSTSKLSGLGESSNARESMLLWFPSHQYSFFTMFFLSPGIWLKTTPLVWTCLRWFHTIGWHRTQWHVWWQPLPLVRIVY